MQTIFYFIYMCTVVYNIWLPRWGKYCMSISPVQYCKQCPEFEKDTEQVFFNLTCHCKLQTSQQTTPNFCQLTTEKHTWANQNQLISLCHAADQDTSSMQVMSVSEHERYL